MKNILISKISAIVVPIFIIVGTVYLLRGDREPLVQNHMSTCEKILLKKMNVLGTSYDVASIYDGPIAQVKFGGNYLNAGMFRTKIRETVATGPNFSGHYAVATFDCGSNCQEHAVVDVKTGNMIATGLVTEMGAKFYPNSRILITNPKENFRAPAETDMTPVEIATAGSHLSRDYYELVEDSRATRLEKICAENPFEGTL